MIATFTRCIGDGVSGIGVYSVIYTESGWKDSLYPITNTEGGKETVFGGV